LYAVITERARATDRRLEWWKVLFGEQPRAEVDRIAVASAFPDVGDEVFGRRDDSALLECRHEGVSHGRREVRILAVGLLHAPPPHIVRDVDHGRQDLADAAGLRFARDRLGHT
jgi:hypothetical protein